MARKLITIASGAEQLTLDKKTVRRYIDQGLLTGYRVGPRQLRLDAAEVEALARPIVTVATIRNASALATPSESEKGTATSARD